MARYLFFVSIAFGMTLPTWAQQWYLETPDSPNRITATRGVTWIADGTGYLGFGLEADGQPASGYRQFNPVTRQYTATSPPYGQQQVYERAFCTAFRVGGETYVGLGGIGPNHQGNYPAIFPDAFMKIEPGNMFPSYTAPYPGGKRIDPFSFVINDLAYVGGGQVVHEHEWPWPPEFTPAYDMAVYDHVTDTWTALGNTPVHLRNAQTFVIDGTPYVIDDESTTLWSYNVATDTWTERAPYPGGAREGATVLVRQGKAYMGSGYLNGYQNTYYEYDPVSDTWSPGPAIWDGRGRKYAISFTLGDDAYLIGGEGPDNRTRYEIWRLGDESGPLPSDTLVQRNFMPAEGRTDPIAFSIGDKGYFGGGKNGSGNPLTDLWMYDPATDTWTERANMPASGMFGLSLNGTGYLMTAAASNNLHAYDPVADAWMPRADRPNGAMDPGSTGFAVEGKLYVWGGMSSGPHQFWSYDPVTDTWEQRADRPGTDLSGNGGMGFTIGNRGYIASGWMPGTQTATASYSTSCYNPATDTWSEGGSFLVPAFADGQIFAIGNRAYVIGGDRILTTTNRAGIYDPVEKTWEGLGWSESGFRYRGIGLAIGEKGYILGGRRHMRQVWLPDPPGSAPISQDPLWTVANDLWEYNPTVVEIEGIVLLDGPYDADEQLMGDELNTQGLLPLTDPYGDLGYPHPGGNFGDGQLQMPEGLTRSASVVDRIVVELRKAADPTKVVATRHIWLQRDGTLVDMGGSPRIRFTAPAGDYYVAVRHRNHLGTMTATPVTIGGPGTVSVDFSSPATATYGTEARKVADGVALLWSGDVTFSGTVSYTGPANDRDRILQRVGGEVPTTTVTGYFNEDVNMDGVVKYTGVDNDRDPILEVIGGEIPTVTREEQMP